MRSQNHGSSTEYFKVPLSNVFSCNADAEFCKRFAGSVSRCLVNVRDRIMAIENLQPLAYAVASIAFALGTSSIFLRLYCRWRLRTFGSDDYMVVLLFVSIVASLNEWI